VRESLELHARVCGLCEELGGENPNGHPMQKVLDHLWDAMNDIGGTIIIVLDEIDNPAQTTRFSTRSLVRAIRITLTTTSIRRSSALATTFNGVTTSTLPRKTASTTTRFFFAPYDANELRDILSRRASKAFPCNTSLVYETSEGEAFEINIDLMTTMVRLPRPSNEIDADRTDCTLLRINSGVLSDDVMLCAAYAAQDKGSARQAIKYLRKAAAIAESEGDVRVEEEHVRTAQGEAERELIIEGWNSSRRRVTSRWQR